MVLLIKKQKLHLLIFFVLVGICFQSFPQKSLPRYSVFLMHGKHLTTNYNVDSGSANLVGRKLSNALQVGFNMDYDINKKWGFRTGFSMHAHFISETSFGVSGKLPSDITGEGWLNGLPKYDRGLDYIERFTYSIPLKIVRKFDTKKMKYQVGVGPMISFYNTTRNETMLYTILLDNPNGGNYIPKRVFEINRDFDDKQRMFLGISTPKIEWQLDAEAIYKLKKTGGIVAGIKATWATHNFETAYFTIWPNETNYRSKGHYSINRSYIGLYLGYRFGQIK